MKTTTFDQLKSMLKSMSLSIFPRLRNMERNIDEIKATIPTPEKEIIFTKGEDGNYSCNIPHAELWEMDADIIGKNARIIDGDKVYGVRGASKKTESLYGNVIQVYADLNVGKYDLSATYHQTLIITYCAPEILGVASAIYGEKVYSLSDARNDNATPDIPVLDGSGWMNRSIDFMEYDASHNVYTLKTMSPTVKGGAMVGKGLKMDGDALTVDEGEYELIEKITLEEDAVIERTQEPDGTPYNFKKIIVKAYTTAQDMDSGSVFYQSNGKTVGKTWWGAIINNTGTKNRMDIVKPLGGYWYSEFVEWNSQIAGMPTINVKDMFMSIKVEEYPTITGFYTAIIQKAGTTVEIWAVRA